MKKVLAIISVLSMLCCFTACGAKHPTRAENQNSSDASSTASEDSTSSTVSEDEETSSADESSEAGSDTESSLFDSSEFESTNSSILDFSSMLDELNSELAEDSSDSSESTGVSSGDTYEYGGVSIDIPTGFEVDDSDSSIVMIYPDTYPEETDNINLTKTNESIALYSEDNINKTMKSIFDDYQGCRNYTQYKIEGCDAVSYDHTITVNGTEITQKQVTVFADSTVVITFTYVSDKYEADFQKVIDNIRIAK